MSQLAKGIIQALLIILWIWVVWGIGYITLQGVHPMIGVPAGLSYLIVWIVLVALSIAVVEEYL